MKEEGLNNITITLMISVALFFDAVQGLINLIPFFGQIFSGLISMMAFLTFFLWFKIKGISFSNPKKAGMLVGGFIVELIPILNILPGWTLAITKLALDSKLKQSTPRLDIIKK